MLRDQVSGVGFLLFTVVGAGLAGASLREVELPSDRDWSNGDWAAAFEERFDEESLLRLPGTTFWGVAEYGLYRQGRPGVIVGDEGWLFTDEELAWHPDEDTLREQRLDEVASVRAALAVRGIHLVVALVPAKARVRRDVLGMPLPSYVEPRYQAALEGLRQRDVVAPDLLEPLSCEGCWLRTDTHWTPRGAQVAARALAAEAQSRGWLSPSGTWTTTEAPEELFEGDLLGFVPLGPLHERMGLIGEPLRRRTTEGSGGGGGLFDEVTIPVTVVGTSYTAIETWNFVGALKEAFGGDVLDASQQGRGPIVPMREYLQNPALDEAPPTVLVWEIPERSMVVEY